MVKGKEGKKRIKKAWVIMLDSIPLEAVLEKDRVRELASRQVLCQTLS